MIQRHMIAIWYLVIIILLLLFGYYLGFLYIDHLSGMPDTCVIITDNTTTVISDIPLIQYHANTNTSITGITKSP